MKHVYFLHYRPDIIPDSHEYVSADVKTFEHLLKTVDYPIEKKIWGHYILTDSHALMEFMKKLFPKSKFLVDVHDNQRPIVLGPGDVGLVVEKMGVQTRQYFYLNYTQADFEKTVKLAIIRPKINNFI